MDKIYLMNAAQEDKALTGDPKSHAEWIAPDESTICGITPNGRYVIKRNKFGTIRYDEDIRATAVDFELVWRALQYSETAPVKQNALLRKEFDEAEYNRTHRISTACLIMKMEAAAGVTR